MTPHQCPSLDTTPEAARVYYDTLRKLGPERRLAMVGEMNSTVRELAAAGVRDRHPEYDDAKVNRAVVRLLLGEKLFREVFPGDETRP